MAASMNFEYGFTRPAPEGARRRDPEAPLRILMIGDFSGREARGVCETGPGLASRPLLKIDVDNFDGVMARCAPSLPLRAGEVTFRELEDFHPDTLYRELPLFSKLRELRKRLRDNATFSEAAAELREMLGRPAGAEAPAPEEPPPAPVESDGSTLERLLGRSAGERPAQHRVGGGAVDIGNLIRDAVAPHIVPEADPHQDLYVAAVDEAIQGQMRALLAEPAFRGLEAAWRSAWSVVTGVETDEEELTLHLLDLSRAEVAADLAAAGADLAASGLYKLLVERGVGSAGGQPWSALVADFTFRNDPAELSTLASLAAIASQAGGPVLAAAHPEVIGAGGLRGTPDPAGWAAPDPEAEARWTKFRESPLARWVGLALPRILTRLPYGEKGEALDAFTFEEAKGPEDHEAFPWGNPAFGLGLLIARSFRERGWSFSPGDHLDLEDLPAFTCPGEDGPELLPCAEAWISERTGEAILARGLMPLMSYRNRNAVRVMRFQSLASPGAPLAGPWGES